MNRSTTDAVTLRVELAALTSALGREVSVVETQLLHDEDRYAANTLDEQERVLPRALEGVVTEGTSLVLPLPAIAWAAVRLS